MDFHELAQRTGAKIMPDGSGRTHCPVCQTADTDNPALDFRDAGGKLLVKCHKSDCDFVAIMRTVGGDVRDAQNSPSARSLTVTGKRTDNAQKRASRPSAPSNVKRRVVATYEYTDEDGNVLYVKERYEPKHFGQYRPLPDGGKDYKLGDVRRVPYNLPAIMRAPLICLVEGEKDVERLRSAGLVATSSKDWRPEFAAFLEGKRVAIIPDNDEPGDKIARAAHDMLRDVAQTWIVDLPDVKDGGDVSDYLRDHTQRELVELVESVMNAQPANMSAHWPAALTTARFFQELTEERDGLPTGWSRLDAVFDIPRGGVTLVSANSGVGKTTFQLNVAYNLLQTDRRVAFFTYEERASHLAAKLIVRDAQVKMHAEKNVGFTRAYIAGAASGTLRERIEKVDAAIMRVTGWLDSGQLLINDVEPDAETLCRQIEAVAAAGFDAVFVDYAQQLRHSQYKGDNRRLELARISAELRNVAKHCDVAIVVGSQVTAGEIRDARDLEFDALAILHLTRDDVGNGESPDLKVEIKKNRNGVAGVALTFEFDGKFVKIADRVGNAVTAGASAPAEPNNAATLPPKWRK